MQKNALGKGLGALISGASRRGAAAPVFKGPEAGAAEARAGAAPAADMVRRVPLTDLVPSPMQPRKTFRDEQLVELMDSIREHGVIQPLTVRRVNGRMELIAGERRFRACQALGLPDVPVIERVASDREVLEMALIENLQREDLNPVEEAEAYHRLAKEFNMKQEEIARRVGKNRATVANAMRLLDLAPEVKSHLALGRLTAGHAKAILSLRDPALQCLVAEKVVRQGLTVRETERAVQMEQAPSPSPAGGSSPRPPQGEARESRAAIQSVQNALRDHLATNVVIHHGEKKGRIEIEYYGNDDLNRILERLGVEMD